MEHRKTILAFAFVFVFGCAGKVKVPVASPELVENDSDEGVEGETDLPDTDDSDGADDSGLEDQPPVVTTLSLCEPIGERWPYPTDEQKKETRALIKKTCKAMDVGKEDCKYFYSIISLRESGYRYGVRHKLSGDVSAALSAYLRLSESYGWSSRWPTKDRKAEDFSKIQYKAYGDEQNPYFIHPERWMFGLGLGGLNISYHLAKFDNLAPPEILCDPVINIMVQVTIARNAVSKYNAQNFAEVQAVYAGRTVQDDDGRARPLSCTRGCPKNADADQRTKARKGDEGILKRCDAQGLDCYRKPQLGSKLVLQNMTREERHEAADGIRGSSLPVFDTPPDVVMHQVDSGALEG